MCAHSGGPCGELWGLTLTRGDTGWRASSDAWSRPGLPGGAAGLGEEETVDDRVSAAVGEASAGLGAEGDARPPPSPTSWCVRGSDASEGVAWTRARGALPGRGEGRRCIRGHRPPRALRAREDNVGLAYGAGSVGGTWGRAASGSGQTATPRLRSRWAGDVGRGLQGGAPQNREIAHCLGDVAAQRRGVGGGGHTSEEGMWERSDANRLVRTAVGHGRTAATGRPAHAR